MELDFSTPWLIVPPEDAPEAGSAFPGPALVEGPAAFAAAELAAILGRMTGEAPRAGGGSESRKVIVLRAGGHLSPAGCPEPAARPSARRLRPAFSWSAAEDRVEIVGEDGRGLVRGVYDFLESLGAAWVCPGAEGERLPSGPRLSLAESARSSTGGEACATLILGHGAFLEAWEDQLTWAARAGYSSVFIHSTDEELALGAAPERLYEALRDRIAPLARRVGLSLELGGHFLSSFLPRGLFAGEPGLFRQAPGDRDRSPEANFCVSNPRALGLAARNFALFAADHPEIEIFHAWPDDLPGGGWCSCPDCASLAPAAQSLAAARALAAALAEARPGAGLSFLAYHDTEDLAGLDLAKLPPNLELLWAPRRRCWAHGLDEALCELDAASSRAYRAASAAWKAAGGGTAVFEYWGDAILFKGAVPPLSRTMAGDLAVYTGPGAGAGPETSVCAVGILLAGGRLPLAPRPNPWLLPRLLARGPGGAAAREIAAALLARWIGAAYGPAAGPMARYWAALEEAWALDLALESGDTRTDPPATRGLDPDDPPIDWGDPWPASPERLEARLGTCESLFGSLREAEAALDEALALAEGGAVEPWAEAVRAESREYAIAGNLLELDCARLAAYREAAAGQVGAAADLALLATSPYAALSKAYGSLPDPRSRREMRLLLLFSHGLRLGALRRRARRGGPARAAGRAAAWVGLALRAMGLRRAWEEPRADIAPARPRG